MPRTLIAFLITLTMLAAPASAQERVTLGSGRLFTNDTLGDGQDRWRTGSYVASWMRGPDGTVSLPGGFGELIEYRFASQIFAPANLLTPAPGDRRYGGAMSLGAYSHFTHAGYDFALGAELVAVGPMTGLDGFHAAAHTALGMTAPSAAVRAAQFGNRVYPAAGVEVSRPIGLGFGGDASGLVLRPFIQGRAGDETYARAGADLLFGPNFTSGVLVRDESTGILYQTFDDAPGKGLSFLLGADTAKVFSSAWLPASGGYTLTPTRSRARAGIHWQGETLGAFYGATWLSPEFTAQPEGQVLGSVQLRLRF
ncbi:lipid A-modifier LpxR family protein [Sinisalibacter aestuarii]|uniref:DUF2219 family protein n=1 Tax=Sinisalibacter aestuarii TaxID=2949426 RepID=A0ABQ5LTR1_9RHOB|nr:lipid A-modifier LpxR family protein [Sinisalibacter aestuarii]GKY88381.1 hypothetical protein STA1M1_22500 [Sinisalibacter aestuarii]